MNKNVHNKHNSLVTGLKINASNPRVECYVKSVSWHTHWSLEKNKNIRLLDYITFIIVSSI